jgi:hypothetical protein
MIELTSEETAQILRQREATRPKVDTQRAELLADLDELNTQGRTAGYGPLPRGLDRDGGVDPKGPRDRLPHEDRASR